MERFFPRPSTGTAAAVNSAAMGKRAANAAAARRRAATGKTAPGLTRLAAGNKEDRARRAAIFVAAYLSNGQNRAHAAVQAGFSPHTAASIGSEFLAKPEIRKLVEDSLNAKLAAAEFSAQEVVNDLRDAMRFDRRELYGEDGKLLPVHLMSRQAAAMVEGVEIDYVKGRGTVAKVKMERRIATRDQAMRYFGLYKLEEKAKDPDEAARTIRERLGDIERLTGAAKGKSDA